MIQNSTCVWLKHSSKDVTRNLLSISGFVYWLNGSCEQIGRGARSVVPGGAGLGLISLDQPRVDQWYPLQQQALCRHPLTTEITAIFCGGGSWTFVLIGESTPWTPKITAFGHAWLCDIPIGYGCWVQLPKIRVELPQGRIPQTLVWVSEGHAKILKRKGCSDQYPRIAEIPDRGSDG